jgi:UDP-N-acetylmuramoyl-L-alanyl-D-glutamate--2,6-diaminopimelate ligase
MVKAGISHVVLETTSHGLAQKRVATCEYDIAVVTNITHEHLDYHRDYQGYLTAKAELLNLVAISSPKPEPVSKLAVINADDGSYQPLKKRISDLGINYVDYGVKEDAGYLAEEIHSAPGGLAFDILNKEQRIPIKSHLVGAYNISNCLAAASACREGLGVDWEDIQRGIISLGGIPGRMESIDLGQDFLVIVDFAHTPNALHEALRSARELTSGRLIAIFGSAGLRDREKRRLMAERSVEMADLTILTAEDPRTESLPEILEEMSQGASSRGGVEGESYWRVPDRGDAIRKACQLAEKGDLVIICGKGHEQSMCFGETEYPWDDRKAARAALSELLGEAGPEMPYLPTQS